ncbi:MAG: hypothetical protein LBG90_01575 [Spirochaetaceae bacterium]|nr:hypothetical protein [Spirochaetaceae bacterium]
MGSSCLSAQAKPTFGEPGFVSPSGHQGAVKVLAEDDRGRVLSGGADGFLAIWDPRYNAVIERFQVSPGAIQAVALRTGTAQIGVLERDDIGIHHISVWNYETKERRFTVTFRDGISYLGYSGGGAYLIAAQSGKAAALIQAETGEILGTLNIGPASFAATGKSERTMLTYAPSGILSYWDLGTGQEIRRFSVPSRMESLILFGSNRFLAGLTPNGLVILDAVSGTILAQDRLLSRGFLLPMKPESSEFMGLGPDSLYHFVLSSTGKLELKTSWPVPGNLRITSAALTSDAIALGTSGGDVCLGQRDGTVKPMRVMPKKQRLIADAAPGKTLAFLTKTGGLGFIPGDYYALRSIKIEQTPYTRIASDPAGGLLLWQDEDTKTPPVFRSPEGESVSIPVSLRFPLRSAALLDDQALFMDSLGNIQVLSLKTRNTLFSFSLMAAQDAVFFNKDNILISRGAVSGNTPFLLVNIVTGETVPLAYPASIGTKVYMGLRGIPYGVVIAQNKGPPKTALLRLNTVNPALTAKLFEWEGEDANLGLTESKGRPVAVLGGYEAFFYDESHQPKPLERTPGFPVKLIDAGSYVIALDSEGTIAWHDAETGKICALLRLYEDDTWLLQEITERLWRVSSGPITR